MRIVLDARYKVESGASSYIKNLIPHLLELREKEEFFLVRYKNQQFDFESDMCGVLESPYSDLASLAWTFTALPNQLHQMRADLYHALKMPGPVWGKAHRVFTMHSITDRYKGEFPVNLRSKLFNSLYVNRTLGRMDHIVSVSDFVTDCLRDRHSIDRKLVTTVYHGIDSRFRLLEDPACGDLGISKPFILCVGNVTPVKNHLTAVRAFATISSDFDYDLVIAGDTSSKYHQDVVAEASRLGVTDRLHFTGFLGVQNLVQLMNCASLLLFPSLTEGCPVTMLEAFGCGLPILASRRGGLWDVGKNYCEFVEDPLDHEGFAGKLRSLLGSSRTLNELRASSLRAAQRFSWQESATKHMKIYRQSGPPDVSR